MKGTINKMTVSPGTETHPGDMGEVDMMKKGQKLGIDNHTEKAENTISRPRDRGTVNAVKKGKTDNLDMMKTIIIRRQNTTNPIPTIREKPQNEMKETETGQIIKITLQDMRTIISQAMINIMKKTNMIMIQRLS